MEEGELEVSPFCVNGLEKDEGYDLEKAYAGSGTHRGGGAIVIVGGSPSLHLAFSSAFNFPHSSFCFAICFHHPTWVGKSCIIKSTFSWAAHRLLEYQIYHPSSQYFASFSLNFCS